MHVHAASKERLRQVFLLLAGYGVIEVVASILLRSWSLQGDGWHMGSDAASVGLAYLVMEIRERTPHNSHERIERLGTAAIAVLILIAAIQLIGHGINRILHPLTIRGELVGLTAFLGLGVNLVCIARYRKVEGGAMIRLSRAHLIGDTLNSVAVIASGVGMAWKNWYWLDGLTAIGIGLYLLGQIFLRDGRESHGH